MKPGKTGIARLVDATRYSWQGFQAAYRHEAAFRQELAGVVIAIPVAYWLSRDSVQFLLLIVPLLLLLLVELINSAIEAFSRGTDAFNKAVQDFGDSMDTMTKEMSSDIEESNRAAKIREKKNKENLEKIWGTKK